MQISQIRYFLAVCKHSSVTKASKELYVSQPSVTVAIKNLEEELGIKLFNRLKQRIFLTEEGKFFFNEVSKILEDLDGLSDYMKDLANKRNNVKVGVPPMIGSFLFPEIFSGFKSEYPEVNLEVYEHGAVKLRELLESEELDITMMIKNIDSENIEFNSILNTKFVLYAKKDHPITKKASVTFEDLAEESMILLNKEFYINKLIRETAKRKKIKNLNVILETAQVQTVKKFISEGVAIGFLIKDCVDKSEGLVEVPFEMEIPITIGIEWKKGKYYCSDIANFLDYVDKKFNQKKQK